MGAVGVTDFGMRFHHMGLAVRAPESAFHFLAALGYVEGASVFDPLQGVNLAMRYHRIMPDVEVIWPGELPSPIDKIIKRGHMIYHLGYVTRDVDASLAAMESAGLEVMPIGMPKPAVLFGGLAVSFHSVDQLGIIELIHGEPLGAYSALEKFPA